MTFSSALGRNFISCCNGIGTKGFPESSTRGWNCSIFPATSSSLQPEETADLDTMDVYYAFKYHERAGKKSTFKKRNT